MLLQPLQFHLVKKQFLAAVVAVLLDLGCEYLRIAMQASLIGGVI